jgi:ATP-binding cassette subfamily F protein uup
VGGYSDWLQQRPIATTLESGRKAPGEAAHQAASAEARPRTRLGFKEQRELTSLPGQIEALEREQAAITTRMSAPEYHLQGAAQIRADRKRIEEIEASLIAKFERWEALEAERSRLAR